MTIQIERVDSRRGIAQFVSVPWEIRDGDHPTTRRMRADGMLDSWVLPLRVMVREMIDTGIDPFWKNAERVLFVARRGDRLVGRIAGIENRRHNEVHGDRVGFFGFFDCEDDPEVSRALFNAAEGWLVGRGLTHMRGPTSPSMNHECGILVDGFHERPRILTPWNPPWYEPLLTDAGLSGIRDMVGYPFRLDDGFESPPRLRQLAQRVRERDHVEVRPVDTGNIDRESALICDLFNSAWEGNWGFVPMTPDEFAYTARGLKPLMDPTLSEVAMVDGEPIGFSLVIRDMVDILRRIPSGRLGPVALLRLLWGLPRTRHTRVILLGLAPGRRGGSALPILFDDAIRGAREQGHLSGDASWILEENQAIRRPLESLGIEVYRRWRMFEKEIPSK